MSMLSLMTALIVGVEARACMALGCNRRAWQLESRPPRPADSSSDRMCASVGPESEHVGRKAPRSRIDPRGNNKRPVRGERTLRQVVSTVAYFEESCGDTRGTEAHGIPTPYPLARTHIVPDPDPSPPWYRSTGYRACP